MKCFLIRSFFVKIIHFQKRFNCCVTRIAFLLGGGQKFVKLRIFHDAQFLICQLPFKAIKLVNVSLPLFHNESVPTGNFILEALVVRSSHNNMAVDGKDVIIQPCHCTT